jgi:transketolase
LGIDEIHKTRKALDWPYVPFELPESVYQAWDYSEEGDAQEKTWKSKLEYYRVQYEQDYLELVRRLDKKLPENLPSALNSYIVELLEKKPLMATRKASQMALEVFCNIVPEMFGGSADLTGSNLTNYSGSRWLNHGVKSANYLSYGVREFGMAGIMNGMSVYGGFRPYGGTFLVFSDYARNAIRLSAIMKQPVTYVMTHDSIGLGEDGPTHQPVEHLPSLRIIPNLNVWRPADGIETAVAWESAVTSNTTPHLLSLSRQGLKQVVLNDEKLEGIRKGGYLLIEDENPEITFIATGSEVEIMLEASKILRDEGIGVNTVSMPCVEIFKSQSETYHQKVILQNIPALVMEASQPDLWYSLLPESGGEVIGVTNFGESASVKELYDLFGLTVENVINKAHELIKSSK